MAWRKAQSLLSPLPGRNSTYEVAEGPLVPFIASSGCAFLDNPTLPGALDLEVLASPLFHYDILSALTWGSSTPRYYLP